MTEPRKPRGFQCLSPERIREISAMGGAAGAGTKRGFACMSQDRIQELAAKGGRASKRKSLTKPE
jgi:general stress protein YciG